MFFSSFGVLLFGLPLRFPKFAVIPGARGSGTWVTWLINLAGLVRGLFFGVSLLLCFFLFFPSELAPLWTLSPLLSTFCGWLCWVPVFRIGQQILSCCPFYAGFLYSWRMHYYVHHYVLMFYGVRSDYCLNASIHPALHHILMQSAQRRDAQGCFPNSPADVTWCRWNWVGWSGTK